MSMKKINNVSGIYVIECEKYFYIGLSSRLRNRKTQHFSELKNQTHRNQFMQNVYNSGYDLQFRVIEECEVALLEDRELFWYNEWISKHPEKSPLNLKTCGSRPTYSYEARIRMSLGKIKLEDVYDLESQYNLYDFSNNELLYTGTLFDISKSTNISISSLVGVDKIGSDYYGFDVYVEEALDFIPIGEEITADDLFINVNY